MGSWTPSTKIAPKDHYSKMTRVRLIINPIAGTSDKSHLEDEVRPLLEEKGWKVDVVYTRRPLDASKKAVEAVNEGFYAVIGAGGDGTINEIASALRHTKTILGIIPCGSGNGLARHLKIPFNFRKATETILENHPVGIDYAEINGQPFFCTCGVGLDAEVSKEFARGNRRGLETYIVSVLKLLAHYTPQQYVLQIDNQKITETALLISLCNASQYGNDVYISPHASITDGMLDITLIRPGNLLEMSKAVLDLLVRRIDKNPLTQTFHCEKVCIIRKTSGPVHIDGEPIEAPEELRVECKKGGLNVFVNSQFNRQYGV